MVNSLSRLGRKCCLSQEYQSFRVAAVRSYRFAVAANGTGVNSFSTLPVAGSLSRTTPSNPAEASTLPSGRHEIE
jgi:hypothetical protein